MNTFGFRRVKSITSVCVCVCVSVSSQWYLFPWLRWSRMAYESVPPADIVVCAHYCPVCVLSSCERWKEGQRQRQRWQCRDCGRKDACELSKNTAKKVEHKGMKTDGEMESGLKTAVGPPMKHHNRCALMEWQERQIDDERWRKAKLNKRQLSYDTESRDENSQRNALLIFNAFIHVGDFSVFCLIHVSDDINMEQSAYFTDTPCLISYCFSPTVTSYSCLTSCYKRSSHCGKNLRTTSLKATYCMIHIELLGEDWLLNAPEPLRQLTTGLVELIFTLQWHRN